MSGQATGWVLRHGPHPDHLDRNGERYGQRARGMRSVLLTVADAANRDGEHAHPGIAAVCEGALYGRRQAGVLLAELVAEGWLVIESQGGGTGRATVYRMLRMDDDPNRALTAPFDTDPNRAVCDVEPRSLQPEPRSLQPEPRSPGVRSNGLSTVSTTKNPTLAAGEKRNDVGARARRILDALWDERKAHGDPTPANYPATMKAIEACLRSGWPDDPVAACCRTVPTITARTLEVALHGGFTSPSAARVKEQRTVDAMRRRAAQGNPAPLSDEAFLNPDGPATVGKPWVTGMIGEGS